MNNVIQLLPDSVANQIAAGEVVQRPASVIKELIENAIDAGATDITVQIVDSGRTLIQVTDNGKGMNDADARMAFERHATSKIRKAEDIFSITSMGFRGEALASIAAVAHVELKTRQAESEIGTKISIKASEIESHEPIQCAVGSSFIVKNLFYNIPARRKFLKSNETELKIIFQEIYQTALAHAHIAFSIYKDNELHAKYPISSVKQRIVNIFGKKLENGLLPIEGKTSIAKIHGFIGTPDMAKKNSFSQYFFVNNRFFRQRSFQGSIMRSYQNLLSNKDYPPFFVFFEIDPSQIDVNIHPTKTEIKFVEEYNISQLLEAAVKHALGKNNIVPSLDFTDTENYSEILFSKPTNSPVQIPTFDINENYNPFGNSKDTGTRANITYHKPQKVSHWEELFETRESAMPQQQIFISALNSESINSESTNATCIQIQKKYILSPGKTGLMLIHIKRAHSRILFEKFYDLLSNNKQASQKNLLPVRIETGIHETEILQSLLPDLQQLGFDIELFGRNSFIVNGTPADIDISEVENIIQEFVHEFEELKEHSNSLHEKIAITMAKSASLYRNKVMQQEEMQLFIAQLFQCKHHAISADGKAAVIMLEYDEILKKFN